MRHYFADDVDGSSSGKSRARDDSWEIKARNLGLEFQLVRLFL